MRGHGLLKAGIETAALKVLTQLSVIVGGIFVARFLGPHDYGIYSFTMALVGVFILVSQLGFTTYSVKQIAIYQSLKDWVALRSFLIFALSIVLFGATLISLLSFVYFAYFSGNPHSGYIAVGLILVPLSSLFRLFRSYMNGFQFVKQGERIVLSRQIIFMLLCISCLALGFVTFDAKTVLYFQAISTALAGALCVKFLFDHVEREIVDSKQYSHSSTWLPNAASFIMLSAMHYINTQTDILMLGFYRESAEVGYYRVASQAAMLMGFVTQVIILIVGPIVARLHLQQNTSQLQKIITNSTRIIFGFAIIMFVLLYMFSTELIDLLFGSDYLAAEQPLLILCVGKLVVSLFGCAALILNMCGYEKKTTKILLYSALANVVLNSWLVPVYGVVGASIATTIVAIVSSILLYRAVLNHVHIDTFLLPRMVVRE